MVKGVTGTIKSFHNVLLSFGDRRSWKAESQPDADGIQKQLATRLNSHFLNKLDRFKSLRCIFFCFETH